MIYFFELIQFSNLDAVRSVLLILVLGFCIAAVIAGFINDTPRQYAIGAIGSFLLGCWFYFTIGQDFAKGSHAFRFWPLFWFGMAFFLASIALLIAYEMERREARSCAMEMPVGA